ncbi:metal ABC transporter ATP-binding protein [Dehalogenimonas etheniformans]|uniref:Metal ABC transporter ATP-binding protein n=1 Tax=Dehalogenimonas etheniformans TaxID=1536648 RepID=A0A2P5P7E0_9CHLR|nr:metal ABC transporter ATP-binding protein [Dehalogenimonas etheniformans]PPD58223.1 metal ABC transporter ATP-binding protein [Dehalogenimonas etheniformans]QNT75632.1 metal ABC transporter ATP-binding protein [Dehalogenimonas etheniformans]
MVSAVTTSGTDISARDLDIGYDGNTVVAGINFELTEGRAIALIGTNGSGKSTLLKTIVGLLPPIDGQIKIFGEAPGAKPKRIAYLGQFHASGFVLPLRAIDVVRMGRFPGKGLMGRMTSEDNDIVQSAMTAMGVEKLADFPLRAMSGGQQQRVYLAQVLAHRADLLVLDEPTAGLDVGGRERYLQAIKDELCRGASIVVATHDVQDEASLCHQVMLLAHRVVALGPPDQVLTPQTLLETFGIVIGGDQKRFTVLECVHPHDGHRHD